MGAKTGAEKEENVAEPTQITVILRLAAGGYLVYLVFGLLQGLLKPTGGGKMAQPGCAVLFGAVGVFLVGWSLKKFIKGECTKYDEIPGDEKEGQVED